MPSSTQSRNIICVTILALGLSAGPTGGRSTEPLHAHQQHDEPSLPLDVVRWLAAVEQHSPGRNDPPIKTVLSSTSATFLDVRRMLQQRRRAEPPDEFNRLVHRAAVLHMDAGMAVGNGLHPTPRQRSVGPGSMSVLTKDGGYGGLEPVNPHWELGRQLIDLTLPRPSEDRVARLWYIAVAAYFANRSFLADQRVHLARAEKIFPEDADLLYMRGGYFEVMGSPRLQPLIERPALPSGVRITIPSARSSWRDAEEYFRRAIDARSGFFAARIRRAHVLHLLGRHADALAELRQAGKEIESRSAARPGDAEHSYFVALFMGAAHEALGQLPAARDSYERAAALFPKSQSPYLALSRMARDLGNRAEARARADQAAAHPDRSELDDPWWTYDIWQVRDAENVFAELWRSLSGQSGRPGGSR